MDAGSDLWEERVVEDEWRLEDYFGYKVGDTNYQSLVGDQISKGYRVWKVQGYADSTRYAVIVQRDPDGGPCP